MRAKQARSRLRRGCWRSALIGALLVSRAQADAELETIRVTYEAPADCPSMDAFLTDVRRSAPQLRLTNDERARTFLVSIRSDGNSRGRLTIAKDGTAVGSRDVEGATCGDVSRVLAFAVALAIDPNATPPPELVTPLAPPVESRETPAMPPGSWWAASAHALAASGSAPNAAFGGGVSIDLGRPLGTLAPAARLGLEYSSSAPAAADGARVAFANALALLEGCPTGWDLSRLTVRPCARFDAGLRITTGEQIPGARSVTRPWLDIGAMLHLRLRIFGPLFVDLAGGALFALVQDRVFLSPDVTVHTVPPFGGRGEIATGVEFR